ncbi:MAG: type IX secretion system sortase PorU [Candidatus Eisenbacteria bacterium]|nr:type IX secretion system sortase PorU [Candidatus Eisenbacteria bacterium]
MRYLAIAALIFAGAAWPSSAANVELVSSDLSAVVVRCVSEEPVLRDFAADGIPYAVVRLDGADQLGIQGAPNLPVLTVRLAVPECRRVRHVATTSGGGRIDEVRPSPEPTLLPVEEGHPSESTWLEGPVYEGEGLWPETPAVVTEPLYFATQRVVEVEFTPCRYDRSSGALVWDRVVEVTLTFEDVVDAPPPRGDLPRRERLLRSAVLNYGSGRAWRRAWPLERSGRPDDYYDDASNWARLKIETSGVHRVSYSDLDALGAAASSIDPSTFRVFSGGGLPIPESVTEPRPEWMQECAIHVDDGGDGSFDAGDGVVFHALASDAWSDELEIADPDEPFFENPYTSTSVYWLAWESGGSSSTFTDPPRRAATEPDPGAADRAVSNYRARVHFEENVYERQGRGDNWFWYEMKQQGDYEERYFHEILSGVQTDSTGTLRGRVDGSSSDVFVSPDHIAEFYLNDQLADIGEWDGYGTYTFETSGLPMREGYNTYLVVVPREDDDHEEDYILIDWFELLYWRELVADAGRARFGSSGRTGAVEYLVDGFSDADVSVYRLDGKYDLTVVGGVATSASPNGYEATFVSEVADTASYEVVQDGAWLVPDIEIDAFGDLRTPNGADYLMIVYDGFYDEALRLAAFRQTAEGGGFSVRATRLSDVYDEFSWGMIDPTAIRDYLKHTWESSDPPPTHTLLVGDASSDYRQYLASSTECYLPTHYSGGSYWPAEFWFVGFDAVAGYLPAMALGRLPARSSSELSDMVDKITGYVTDREEGLWHNRAILVSDDQFKGAEAQSNCCEFFHTEQCEELAREKLPFPLDRRKIYLFEYERDGTGINKPGARADFLEAWNEGAVLVNYTGHGSEIVMAHENVFLYDDAYSLENDSMLPLFFAASCRLNKFDQSTVDSMGELFAKLASRGSIASIGSTRDSGASQNASLNRSFYSHMFGGQQTNATPVLDIGSSLQAAFSATSSWSNNTKFMLVGDPGTVLATPSGTGEFTEPDFEPMRRRDTVTVAGQNDGASGGRDGVVVLAAHESADTSGYIHEFQSTPTYHVDYRLPGRRMFEGPVGISGGELSADFVVSALANEGPYGRVRAYFYGTDVDGVYSYEDVALRDSVATSDVTGPEIDTGVQSGAVVPGSTITIAIEDESGINLVDSGGAHGIVLRVDGGDSTALTDRFLYDLGSSTRGTIEYALGDLGVGSHSISVSASDNMGNRTVETTSFSVLSSLDFDIRNVANYPNPFPAGSSEGTHIMFQLPSPAEVDIDIFTVGGRRIRMIHGIDATAGANQVYWDGRDQEGDEIANGVYLYRIHATSDEYRGDRVEAVGRAVVMR